MPRAIGITKFGMICASTSTRVSKQNRHEYDEGGRPTPPDPYSRQVLNIDFDDMWLLVRRVNPIEVDANSPGFMMQRPSIEVYAVNVDLISANGVGTISDRCGRISVNLGRDRSSSSAIGRHTESDQNSLRDAVFARSWREFRACVWLAARRRACSLRAFHRRRRGAPAACFEHVFSLIGSNAAQPWPNRAEHTCSKPALLRSNPA